MKFDEEMEKRIVENFEDLIVKRFSKVPANKANSIQLSREAYTFYKIWGTGENEDFNFQLRTLIEGMYFSFINGGFHATKGVNNED